MRVVEVLRRQPGVLVGAVVVSLVAYVLILIALRLSQLSYIAALRELSVVGSAVVGWHLLGEPQGFTTHRGRGHCRPRPDPSRSSDGAVMSEVSARRGRPPSW
jgi:hypothetical protein